LLCSRKLGIVKGHFDHFAEPKDVQAIERNTTDHTNNFIFEHNRIPFRCSDQRKEKVPIWNYGYDSYQKEDANGYQSVDHVEFGVCLFKH
jgi:hypothetical protein